MPGQAQLEIIAPSGEMKFYDLDPAKGVANIGQHPDNDVIIDSPSVAPFHAVLDHRQVPFQIMVLAETGQTKVRGEVVAPNVFENIHNWDAIEIDGYSIIVLEGAQAAPDAAAAVVPGLEPDGEAVARPEQAIMGVPLPDLTDDIILTVMPEREWTVDVDQTANLQVSVTNGGDIVAAFDVRVEGIDPEWVTIMPAEFNLNERAQSNVTISITPPRLTSSRAGSYPLSVSVTSPNYSGHISRMGGLLVVNPFYDFFVGELSPKQQTASWFRRAGQINIPIGNRGNSEVPFRLDGEDDERGCRFEFEVPGEEALLVKQAEMRLAPDDTYYVPVLITPVRRRFIALRSRQFSYTITAALVEGMQTPRSVMGRIKVRPLIGPVLILLFLLLVASMTFFFVRPAPEPALLADRTVLGQAPDPVLLASLVPESALFAQGLYQPVEQTVTLNYDSRRFPSLGPTNLLNHQNTFFLNLQLEFKTGDGAWQVARADSELLKPMGSVSDVPIDSGRYRLRADTWVSSLLPMFTGWSREVPVYVSPVEPVIEQFIASKTPIWTGEEVTIFWTVAGAETLTLVYDGIEESLQDAELQSGQRTFMPETDTTYTLIAGNSSWPEPVQKPLTVVVLKPTVTPAPTGTPIPTPVVLRFDVDPLEITVGELVRIDWEVEGADSVSVEPVEQGLPPNGNIGHQPQVLTVYQLIAYKAGDTGAIVQTQPQLKEVIVNPEPTPTTVPVAPVVDLFDATPKEIIRTVTDTVMLTWSVSGFTTDIQITGPNLTMGGLKAQDRITVTLKETTLLVLTAFNGDLSSSLPVEVTVLEPTPTPTATPVPTDPPPPTPTPTATPTATPFPPPNIMYYTAKGQEGYENKVAYQSQYDTENGTVYVYTVEAGSFMELGWQVSGAEEVSIGGFGPQPATGTVKVPDRVTSATTHILTAKNNGGLNTVSAFIQVEVVSPPPPPPPYNVTGQEDAAAGTNTINWSYATADRDRIDSFRIYRASVPPGTDFAPAWTTEDATTSTWMDNLGVGETCGKAYYIVAVYTDLITNAERETAASPTSWYSKPCQP